MEQELVTSRFIRALKKNQISQGNNKQIAKILSKMEKGKNLKAKEFNKVYFLLRSDEITYAHVYAK